MWSNKLPTFLVLAGLLGIGLFPTQAQSQVNLGLNGYLSNMQSVMFEDLDGSWIMDNTLHNRLNFQASVGRNFELHVEARNRFFYGETVKYSIDYADLIGRDPGWKDLSWNLRSDSSFLLNTTLDRAFLDFSIGSVQVTAGRQRINWGMNFVWNPNDLFNSYSFFDFDYVERPGSDALRIQYYLSSTASAEAVAKIDENEKWSAAGLLRVNMLNTDFQLLGGVLTEDEYVIGGGFSGYLGPISMSGEVSYLDPINKEPGKTSATIGGFGLSYSTPFQLFAQFEYLYNSAANQGGIKNFNDFYYTDLSLRDLSLTTHTFFGSLSYPMSPLLNLGFSGMYFPALKGLYLGPSVDLSLRNDLDLSFFFQSFGVEFDSVEQNIHIGFLRLKWSF